MLLRVAISALILYIWPTIVRLSIFVDPQQCSCFRHSSSASLEVVIETTKRCKVACQLEVLHVFYMACNCHGRLPSTHSFFFEVTRPAAAHQIDRQHRVRAGACVRSEAHRSHMALEGEDSSSLEPPADDDLGKTACYACASLRQPRYF